MEILVKMVHTKDISFLREIFEAMDTDGNFIITLPQLKNALK